MKTITSLLVALIIFSLQANAQQKTEDKSKRPSPPAMVTQKIDNGATITINYSQPSLKGRTIGKDVEPMEGKVWRTGANEATVFETDRDITVDGMPLPAGKYGLFTIFNGNEVTFIFNKVWKQWGAFNYKAEEDQLRIKTPLKKSGSPAEKMTFTIDKNGKVSLLWGDRMASFQIK